jgi:hypothetical protein
MPYGTTAKWALRKLLGTSLVSDIDAGFAALADDIDPLLSPFSQGTLASRPVSTPGSPGKSGRVYRATDLVPPAYYHDHGTGWDELRRGERTHYAIVATNQAYSIPDAQDVTNTFNTEIADEPNNDQHAAGAASQLKCTRAGLYQIVARVEWATGGGTRAMRIMKNGGEIARTEATTGGAGPVEFSLPTIESLAVNDIITVIIYQASGGNLSTPKGSLRWAWLSP